MASGRCTFIDGAGSPTTPRRHSTASHTRLAAKSGPPPFFQTTKPPARACTVPEAGGGRAGAGMLRLPPRWCRIQMLPEVALDAVARTLGMIERQGADFGRSLGLGWRRERVGREQRQLGAGTAISWRRQFSQAGRQTLSLPSQKSIIVSWFSRIHSPTRRKSTGR